jgi:molybdopterin biosynthesis enzyme
MTPVYPRQNVGRQGADIVVGQKVISRGDVLNPSRIGALAALGVGDVEVYAKPSIAILSTGNEIADPGRNCGRDKSTTSTSSRSAPSSRNMAAWRRHSPPRKTPSRRCERAIDACASCDVLVSPAVVPSASAI